MILNRSFFVVLAVSTCSTSFAQSLAASDCAGALAICSDTSFNVLPPDVGAVVDLDAANRGCLVSNEHMGQWHRFTTNAAGTLAFSINVPPNVDYDLAVWGPYTSEIPCPPSGQPLRCSFSSVTGAIGLDYAAIDLSEGAGGNGWVRYIDVLAGETYILYVDNFSMNGLDFDLVFDNEPDDLVECLTTGAGGPWSGRDPLSVQPNPADDHLFVSASLIGDVEWRILDSSGRLMSRGRMLWTDQGVIGIDGLAQGAYTLRLIDGSGKSGTVLFIKR
ncbi:MAG: hypothetical protein ABI432_05340 [Flavobacteriales bacterium]